MSRIFDEHVVRNVQSLNGAWRFATDPSKAGEDAQWFCSLPEGKTVIVPSVWNTDSGLLAYEGVAWYEKKFHTAGGCLRLCFGAVLTYAKVWLDGEYVGDHYGGFCQFSFLLPNVSAGYHTLTVRVDNGYDAHSIPQKVVDWYPYGGITRDVSIERLEGICVLNNRLEYTLSDDLTQAVCRPIVELYNAGTAENGQVTVALDQKIVCGSAVTVPAGEEKTVVLPEFTVDAVKLWAPETPNLYDLCISTVTDDLNDRIGFRHVCVQDKKILLNGKPLQIRGVNRHDDHPDFGFAFPPSRIKHDIELITGMNCNAIRGAHYPNSQLFVDYLDETGVLFWSEIPIWGWGFSEEALADPIVVERGMRMHEEMVRYYYNHPSIIFWGLHNEILANTQPAWEMSKRYYTYLKETGGNRLVVYAANQYFTDICCEYSDVVCVNAYEGWYGGTVEDWAPFLAQYHQRMKELGMEDKPFIMSEFGGAAIFGFRDAEASVWSEEYQAYLLRESLKTFGEDPMLVGAFIWHFADIRTSAEMGFSRSRGYNNKGIMSEYRRPKAAYAAVTEAYQKWKDQQ